jgi:hypothetical protein
MMSDSIRILPQATRRTLAVLSGTQPGVGAAFSDISPMGSRMKMPIDSSSCRPESL